MQENRPYEGGCLCGAVRYRATAAPVRGVICHCPQCRRHSGTPALAFVHFPAQSFTWLRGAPRRYQSSQFAQRGFCADCGSTLSMHEEVLADRVQIAAGSLDEPERVRIDDHVWTKDQVSWFTVEDGLPRFSTSSSRVPTKAV
jgi:hypothetical protein